MPRPSPRPSPQAAVRLAGLLFVALSLSSIPALADPWQPLDVGRRWEYRGIYGAHQVESITGTVLLRGREVAIKHYSEGANAGLDNYWQLGADGSVLLCGFNNPSAPFALAYEPPITYLPGPPALGASHTTNVTAYDITTGLVYATFTIQFVISEETSLILPAGTFHALGTGQAVVQPSRVLSGGRAFTLDGRALPSGGAGIVSTATDWYADGFGDVQYQSDDLYQLVTLSLPTAIAGTSWGVLKRLYR